MTKTFTIAEATPPAHLPGTYEVEIRQMHGDADAYSSLIVKPFRTEDFEALTSLIETLDRMRAKYPHGRGGSWPAYGFQDVEGFYSWFSDYPALSAGRYTRERPLQVLTSGPVYSTLAS